MLAKIRMKTTGPAGKFIPGKFLRLDKAAADALVDGGHAEYASAVSMEIRKSKGKK